MCKIAKEFINNPVRRSGRVFLREKKLIWWDIFEEGCQTTSYTLYLIRITPYYLSYKKTKAYLGRISKVMAPLVPRTKGTIVFVCIEARLDSSQVNTALRSRMD